MKCPNCLVEMKVDRNDGIKIDFRCPKCNRTETKEVITIEEEAEEN